SLNPKAIHLLEKNLDEISDFINSNDFAAVGASLFYHEDGVKLIDLAHTMLPDDNNTDDRYKSTRKNQKIELINAIEEQLTILKPYIDRATENIEKLEQKNKQPASSYSVSITFPSEQTNNKSQTGRTLG
ncbi:MAG: hypothetical protein ACO2ZM_08160, partial [Francisellaceae bacterium]